MWNCPRCGTVNNSHQCVRCGTMMPAPVSPAVPRQSGGGKLVAIIILLIVLIVIMVCIGIILIEMSDVLRDIRNSSPFYRSKGWSSY